MNKEDNIKIKVKLPIITDEDISVLDNNFNYIVDEVVNVHREQRELALLQLVIKKQQQAINEIREIIIKATTDENTGKDLGYSDCISYDDILQIIDKVLGDEK